ncbi:hypothetical protein AYI70_g5054 [Smittium culicis]|uniref:Uncharacterized protein n=1 Tax=Smittium culicis TaxID=133412 RepID=A0A1R1XW88_9FUNG|nr:hypothetical protein AYI70_g5054 [Smittium culicis]
MQSIESLESNLADVDKLINQVIARTLDENVELASLNENGFEYIQLIREIQSKKKIILECVESDLECKKAPSSNDAIEKVTSFALNILESVSYE